MAPQLGERLFNIARSASRDQFAFAPTRKHPSKERCHVSRHGRSRLAQPWHRLAAGRQQTQPAITTIAERWRPWKRASGTRAYRLGMLHGLGNVVVVILFAISWWLRQADPGSPSVVALCFMLVGAALSLVTGWLGGELVDRLGVGVDDGAHLDAPSSLSSKPARP